MDKDKLVERLRSSKPDQPSWWMIERDDLEFRPAYLHNSDQTWVPDWRGGTRFSSRSQAEKMAHYLHPGVGIVRSHGMMTEYYNPDGPDAADVIEAMEAARSGTMTDNVIHLKGRGYIEVEQCDLDLEQELREAYAVNGPVCSIIAEFREEVVAAALRSHALRHENE